MNNFIPRLFLRTLAFFFLAIGTVNAQPSLDKARVWIAFERFSPDSVRQVRTEGGEVHHEFPRLNAVAVTLPKVAIERLRRLPNVVSIEEDPIRMPYAQVTPYGISMVQADKVSDANAYTRKVCVIDSGYAVNHEDLQYSFVTYSVDNGTGDPATDKCGHGTHVAGTIAALNNSEGVMGVLPSGHLNLHVVKVFGDNCGWTYSSNLVAAVDQCVASGANVINMSLGGPIRSFYENTALNNYYNQGALLVAAAGNDGTTRLSFPASYNSVISVAAVDSNKNVASFSQKNSQIELAAPGVGVLSTVPWLNENSLSVNNVTYAGNRLEFAAQTSPSGLTGQLVDGGLCDAPGVWGGKVVLCQRGNVTFCDKSTSVKNGGGVAAVIYNNVSGTFQGTLGEGCSGATIPGIALSQEDGLAALAFVNQAGVVKSVFLENASGYEAWEGTSMATPHVSGVAALVWSYGPECTNVQIRDILRSSAEDLGTAGRDNATGYGLVRASNALSALNSLPCASNGGGGGNNPPTASFTRNCSDLGCSFNGSGSTDTDGTIASYAWDFGDGSGATGATANHTYAVGGTYIVRLTVTDDDGAAGETSQSVTVSATPSGSISLSTVGSVVRGIMYAKLTWDGATGSMVDIYRNGNKILSGTSNDGLHYDRIGAFTSSSYTYKVCVLGSTIDCSNESTVNY